MKSDNVQAMEAKRLQSEVIRLTVERGIVANVGENVTERIF